MTLEHILKKKRKY